MDIDDLEVTLNGDGTVTVGEGWLSETLTIKELKQLVAKASAVIAAYDKAHPQK